MDTVTLDDIRALDREFLTPAEVGAVLGCDPQSIRVQAATEPWRLGYPVTRVGSRAKIPRLAFIKFMEGLQWKTSEARA